MGNEIVGFGGLNFFIIIFSELTVKCVIRFGAFVRVLKDQWK
jgi:hypothetical protein